jgi:hypothetical protein
LLIKKKKEIFETNLVKGEENKGFEKKYQYRYVIGRVVLMECCEVQ